MKTVEQAEKARVDAMNKVAEEKQKIHMAKKNCKEEIAKINKKANSMILDMKRKMQFWQVISIGSLMIGMLVGWLL